MAVYAVTGKLGSGKGKGAMKIMRDYLNAGKRVATNMDVFLEHLLPVHSRTSVVRVPDKPSKADLYLIGSGNKFIDFHPIIESSGSEFVAAPPSPILLPGFDESHNGALFLDECASWLNTRDFQDKSRKGLLEWAIHARKYGWDVYFICQNIKQIDAQLRESLFEYVVRMTRLDRMKIPFVSAGVKFMTAGYSDGSMPRLHIGVVRLGSAPDALVADRWFFRGDDLQQAYNTTQVFSDSYPHAIHSALPSWHLQARAEPPGPDFVGPLRGQFDHVMVSDRPIPPKPPHKHMMKFLVGSLAFGALLGVGAMAVFKPSLPGGASPVADVVLSQSKIGASGYFVAGAQVSVLMNDGRIVVARDFKQTAEGWSAVLPDNSVVKGGL